MQKGIFTKFRLKGVSTTGWKRVGPGCTAPKERKAWCRSAKRTMYRSLDRVDFKQLEN